MLETPHLSPPVLPRPIPTSQSYRRSPPVTRIVKPPLFCRFFGPIPANQSHSRMARDIQLEAYTTGYLSNERPFRQKVMLSPKIALKDNCRRRRRGAARFADIFRPICTTSSQSPKSKSLPLLRREDPNRAPPSKPSKSLKSITKVWTITASFQTFRPSTAVQRYLRPPDHSQPINLSMPY